MFSTLKQSCACFNLNQTSSVISQCCDECASDLGYANVANSNCSVSRFMFLPAQARIPPPFSNRPVGAWLESASCLGAQPAPPLCFLLGGGAASGSRRTV